MYKECSQFQNRLIGNIVDKRSTVLFDLAEPFLAPDEG